MLTKTLSGLKVDDEVKGHVTAVFATLNVVDKDGDVTLSGAFEDGAPVKISAYNHASWGPGGLPVGKGTIKEVGDEAILDAQFFLETTAGKDTFETVKQLGELGEWSYGFDILKWSEGQFGEDEDGPMVRFLEKLKTFEVSPVLRGAGVDTRTLAAKGDGLKFADHIDLVVTGVRDLVTRAVDVQTLRAEQGKQLGKEAQIKLNDLDAEMVRLKEVLVPPASADDNQDDPREQLAREALRYELLVSSQ